MLSKVLQASALLALLPYTAVGAVHEELGGVPDGWTLGNAPSEGRQVVFELALNQQNVDKMIGKLYEVSDPDHPNYGNHLDRDEVNDMVKPSKEAHDAVVSWLKKSGVKHIQSDGEWIDFATTVGEANQLLNTQFMNYQKNGVTKLRTTHYSIPDDLTNFVDFITPTVFFGKAEKPVSPMTRTTKDAPAQRRAVAPSCSTSITPSCVKELYHIGDYKAHPKSGSNVAFGSFLNQSAIYKDLFQYEKHFGIPKQSFDVELIRGGKNNQHASLTNVGETDLDVQNIIGASAPLPVREYITGGSPPFVPNVDEHKGENQNEPYHAYYRYLLAKKNKELPQSISNSYGDVEETVPEKYARRVCNQIAMIGTRGITVLESSGDTGVGAGCRSNKDGSPQFEPTFPATCPYVTAIGGTQAVPEVAWTNGSGGFSNYFSQPTYQKAALNTYFTKHIKPSTLKYFQPYFNQKGRGFPDVSAHSLRPDFVVVYKGALAASGGTSAAAPVWNAVVGLLNDARFRNGQKQLGFLNPFLYKKGVAGLTDIKAGGATGCYKVNPQTGAPIPRGRKIPYASWNATEGWDPVTGLGVPNFKKLMGIVTSM